MLSWKHSGFSADASVRVETVADAVRLGRYMIRSPLVLERLNWDDERGEVTYQARPKRSQGPSAGIARWDVLEFIARITDHIPNRDNNSSATGGIMQTPHAQNACESRALKIPLKTTNTAKIAATPTDNAGSVGQR